MTRAEAGRMGGKMNKGRKKGWQEHTARRRARVKALMDEGKTLTPIARALGMSVNTARNDIRAIRMAQ
jgi:DNA-binding NarL/FixJ family response regulator